MKNKGWNRSDKLALAGVIIAIIGTIGAYLALVTPELRKCVGLESGTCPLYNFKFSKDGLSSKAEREEIQSNSWREIPGTYAKYADGEKDIAFINGEKISRNREFVIFDMIGDGAKYNRVEGDCNKLRWRNMRSGFFDSKSQVSFVYEDEDWQTHLNEFQKSILNYACHASQK